jgi:hypothetical protein
VLPGAKEIPKVFFLPIALLKVKQCSYCVPIYSFLYKKPMSLLAGNYKYRISELITKNWEDVVI